MNRKELHDQGKNREPSRNKDRLYKILAGVILAAIAIGTITLIYTSKGEEKPKIGVMNVNGEIRGFEYARLAERARKDSSIKAVVIRINSPGGGVKGTFQTETSISKLAIEKPVVASLQEYAASGAYIISSAADNIYSYEQTTTAGLGVIAVWVSYEDYYDNIGIDYFIWKTGDQKDSFAPWRKPTAEENEEIQELVEQYESQLINRIITNRPETENTIKTLEDGSTVTGSEALELQLVDNIGGYKDAVRKAAIRAGLEDYETVILSDYY